MASRCPTPTDSTPPGYRLPKRQWRRSCNRSTLRDLWCRRAGGTNGDSLGWGRRTRATSRFCSGFTPPLSLPTRGVGSPSPPGRGTSSTRRFWSPGGAGTSCRPAPRIVSPGSTRSPRTPSATAHSRRLPRHRHHRRFLNDQGVDSAEVFAKSGELFTRRRMHHIKVDGLPVDDAVSEPARLAPRDPREIVPATRRRVGVAASPSTAKFHGSASRRMRSMDRFATSTSWTSATA